MNILGIHGGVTINQHDPGAAIIVDGKLVAAIEEERLCRVKSPHGYLPILSIKECLKQARLSIKDIDLVVHPGESYEDMPARIETYFTHYYGHMPKLKMINHHLAHMASGFFFSDFKDSMIVSYDGVGDRLSTVTGAGTSSGIEVLESWTGEQSLGLFFSLITSFLGFQVTEDEYKIMGLAPYGRPGVNLAPLIKIREDGFQIDGTFFERNPPHKSNFEPYYNKKASDLLGQPRRPSDPITQHHKDIAYAAQKALEESAKLIVTSLHKRTGFTNLCIAGGVGLNCSTNYVLSTLPCVKQIFVQPAASDRGLALGCAAYGAFAHDRLERGLPDVYLGPQYSDVEIEDMLKLSGAKYKRSQNLCDEISDDLIEGKIVGWWQGRSEFGPRALGNRSILADPRSPTMKDKINARIKFREEFRPFAPAVLEERAQEIFEMQSPSPFMTIAYPVKEPWRKKIPAVTHVNNTARVQTVSRTTNPLFYDLIQTFGNKSGVPILLNTSFNVRGQPIVETPLDALGTFMASGMDAVVIGEFIIRK